jgi:23S rRNA pseudouridine2605 synthase
VFDFLPLGWHRDIIVGRLDRDSEGLMLLTNDGALAHELMHPSFGVQRVYQVTTKQPLTDNDLDLLVSGIELEDGTSRAVSATRDGERRVRITLEEGRNRQIRRSLDALDHTVTRLVRIQHGPYQLEDLQPGEWREISLEKIS